MYNVVYFDEDDDGGGVCVIRLEWLTPKKRRYLRPPHKSMTKGSIVPDDTWKMFNVKRVFYETDNLAKAKEKEAELDSELNSDNDKSSTRRYKKSRKIYSSSEIAVLYNVYPTPPTKLPSGMKSSASAGCLDSNGALKNTSAATIAQAAAARTSLTTREKRSTASYLDLTVTPSLKETANTLALDVIAKHLASVQTDIRELQISQQEMLQRPRSCSSTPLEHSLPDGITLLYDDNEALIIIETWMNTTENRKHLATYLSLVGGNKVPAIIRRILEKLFTNRLAGQCN